MEPIKLPPIDGAVCANADILAAMHRAYVPLGVGAAPDGNHRCPRCGYVTADVFNCPTCRDPDAPFGGSSPPGAQPPEDV